ncbi:hypothetical protein IMCC3317_37390 [Kordia antarctica]|uniref:Uncharacterized protein n=1 Tax=Kordia antarctica TaxID=1218801 RepID=A0A7L4ZNN2_9FLAO|nr:hypothetical protein IMCC3317_37390 [Kordia antarctica]
MKKKNLKSLALNRKTISNLDATMNTGGIAISEMQCPLTIVDINGGNLCLRSVKCELTGNCVSVRIACITQTEFPTCRDCA